MESRNSFMNKLRFRRRLYLLAVASWVVLALVGTLARLHVHSFSLYLSVFFILVFTSPLVTTIILDNNDCPKCGQRFSHRWSPLLWRGPSPLVFRVHCVNCGFSLFSREPAP